MLVVNLMIIQFLPKLMYKNEGLKRLNNLVTYDKEYCKWEMRNENENENGNEK